MLRHRTDNWQKATFRTSAQTAQHAPREPDQHQHTLTHGLVDRDPDYQTRLPYLPCNAPSQTPSPTSMLARPPPTKRIRTREDLRTGA